MKDRELSSKVLHQIDGDPNEEKNKREKLIEDVRDLYENSKLTYPQIAKVLKTTNHIVNNIVCRFGFTMRKTQQLEKNKIRDQKIIKYVKTHKSESAMKIGERVGVSVSRVIQVLHEHNINKPNPRMFYLKQQIPKIKKMLKNGKTNQFIIKKLHVSSVSVAEIRNELGIISDPEKNTINNKMLLVFQKNKNKIFMSNKFMGFPNYNSHLGNLYQNGKIIRVSRGHYKLNPKWRENKS